MDIRFKIEMRAINVTKPGLMNDVEDAIVKAVRKHGGEIEDGATMDADYDGQYPERATKPKRAARKAAKGSP